MWGVKVRTLASVFGCSRLWVALVRNGALNLNIKTNSWSSDCRPPVYYCPYAVRLTPFASEKRGYKTPLHERWSGEVCRIAMMQPFIARFLLKFGKLVHGLVIIVQNDCRYAGAVKWQYSANCYLFNLWRITRLPWLSFDSCSFTGALGQYWADRAPPPNNGNYQYGRR